VAHPQIAAFPRLAERNAKPTRAIAGQNTLITRTIHDLAYDPVRDEIVVPKLFAQAILTFRGGASGDEAPIRVLHGPDTQLTEPQKLALDPVHNEIFVPLGDRILVFPRDGQGNVAPIRVIEGPDTQMSADNIAVDPVHNLVVVSGSARGQTVGAHKEQVLIFNRTDQGNVKPRAIIRGPKSQILSAGMLTVYPPRELILMSVQAGDGEQASPANFVGVWSIHDNGDIPPRWTIGGPNSVLRDVHAIALNPKNKEVIITDKFLNAVLTFSFPEIF